MKFTLGALLVVTLMKLALTLGWIFHAAPISKVVGNMRIIPAGEGGAYTVSMLDGSRTGYYFDLGERAGELRPKAKRVVLLGLGGGEMLRAARRSLPKADLLGVDIDAKMIRAALDEFHIGVLGARVELDDAFSYVKKLRGADVLMVDLFLGDTMPPAMLMPQFWKDCRAAVSSGGLVMVNIYPQLMVTPVATLMAAEGLREVERKEVKGSTVVFATPQ